MNVVKLAVFCIQIKIKENLILMRSATSSRLKYFFFFTSVLSLVMTGFVDFFPQTSINNASSLGIIIMMTKHLNISAQFYLPDLLSDKSTT